MRRVIDFFDGKPDPSPFSKIAEAEGSWLVRLNKWIWLLSVDRLLMDILVQFGWCLEFFLPSLLMYYCVLVALLCLSDYLDLVFILIARCHEWKMLNQLIVLIQATLWSRYSLLFIIILADSSFKTMDLTTWPILAFSICLIKIDWQLRKRKLFLIHDVLDMRIQYLFNLSTTQPLKRPELNHR